MRIMATKEELIYFPVSTRPEPLTLLLAGTSYCDGSYQVRRRNFPMLVMEYVERGCGTLQIMDTVFTPRAGDVYIVPPWSEHAYSSSASDPWVKHWFNLGGPLPTALLEAYGLSGVWHFRNALDAGSLIRKSVEVLRVLPKERQNAFMEFQLHRIVRALAAFQTSHVAEEREKLPERIREYLHAHIYKPMPDLASIAHAAGRSPAQTIRIFRQTTGKTPYHYLLEQKMRVAGNLLFSSGLPVSEIARSLGFQDEYYFSRLFRRIMGQSPRLFRENLNDLCATKMFPLQ